MANKRKLQQLVWGRKGARAPRARKGARLAELLDEAFALVTAEIDARAGDIALDDDALKALDAELAAFHDDYDLFEGVCNTAIARSIIDALCLA
jgi:histidinol phosphatase-like PHP family hydrolase